MPPKKADDGDMHYAEQLVEAASMYCRTSNAELEAVMQHVSADVFSSTLTSIKEKFGNPDVSERLDIITNKKRYSISDKRAISEYVNKSTIGDFKLVKAESKKLLHKILCPTKVSVPFVINLKLERPERDTSALFEKKVPPLQKHIRYMKRFSKIVGECRIDMSIVRSASTTAYRIADVNKDEFQELYEIEVEHIGDKTRGPNLVSDALKDTIKVISDLMEVSMEPQDMENDRIHREYMELLQIKKFKFAGPNPVTLEKVNLIAPDVDIVSVKDGTYVVTEKADGYRAILMVSAENLLPYYLSKTSMRWTLLEDRKCPPELGGSLLDCELVETLSKKKLLLAFDIFCFGGESVAHLPLGSQDDKDSRSGCMDVFASVFPSSAFRLKRYRPIEEACDILEDAKLGVMIDYMVDGLIYMPVNLPIGGQFVNDAPKSFNSWNRVFKWKPPEKNSIDFLVDVDGSRGIAYLYSEWGPGSEALTASRISPIEFYSITSTGSSAPAASNKPKNNRALFEPCPTVDLVLNGDKRPVAENGDIIESGNIVEFSYDLKRKAFSAMRVRTDKENRANAYNTAMQIWNTIHDPVTEDHVCGRIEITESKEDLMGDAYWRRDGLEFVDLEMNIYHRWMKEGIFKLGAKLAVSDQLLKRKLRMLDMGCGKAGDLSRWRKAGIDGLLGIDFFDDSITNPVDGALSRLTKEARDNYVLVRYDASMPLTPEGFDTSPFASDNEIEHRRVLRAAYGLPGGIDMGEGRNEVAKNGFEIVCCMFAIHYFFDSPEKLDGFVDNVGRSLLKGGIFIGCCFIADRVVELLEGSGEGGVESRTPDGRLVWQISHHVEESSLNAEKEFSRKIDVYVDTINNKITECLVDFDLLQEKLAKYSITLVEEASFDVLYDEYLKEKRPAMNDVQKKLSFLYRYFVFRRD